MAKAQRCKKCGQLLSYGCACIGGAEKPAAKRLSKDQVVKAARSMKPEEAYTVQRFNEKSGTWAFTNPGESFIAVAGAEKHIAALRAGDPDSKYRIQPHRVRAPYVPHVVSEPPVQLFMDITRLSGEQLVNLREAIEAELKERGALPAGLAYALSGKDWTEMPCAKCGTPVRPADAITDTGEGSESGKTFYYCSETCKEKH